MTNKVLVLSGMLLGWHSCTVASVVMNEMVKAQHERSRSHYEFRSADVWENNGLNGKYKVASTWMARAVCSMPDDDVNSMLGFCRGRLNYMYPSKSNRESLTGATPRYPWLKKIYLSCVDYYTQLESRDIYKPAARMLSYCTCTDLPWQEIKDHLSEVRRAIDSNAWTLADAYEFLCVYPKSSFFTRGWFFQPLMSPSMLCA